MSTCSSLRHYRNRKTYKNIRSNLMLILVFIISISWFCWDWQRTNARIENLVFQPQVVRAGDTLWSLAENTGLRIDTRTLVLKIMDYNKLTDANIRVGQVIYTPSSKN